MLSVSLKNIRIHATHGLYEQEHILGHAFEVDVTLQLPVNQAQPFPFIDYVVINKVVQSVFKDSEKFLETLVKQILDQLRKQFPEVVLYKICVRKTQPPIDAPIDAAEVCYEGP